MAIHNEPVYPMSVSERLTGLTRRQIRYYERTGLLRPYRTAGGHRLYTPEEIETLQTIRLLATHGYRTVEAMRRRLAALSGQARTTAPVAPAGVRDVGENDANAYFSRMKVIEARPVQAQLPAPSQARALAAPLQTRKGV